MKSCSSWIVGAVVVLLLSGCTAQVRAQKAPSASIGQDREAAVSPEFRMTVAELRSMTNELPASIRETILARPAAFLSEIAAILREPAIYFVLVDKEHALSAGYAPPDLVNLKTAGLSVARADLVLRGSIMPRVVAMNRKALEDHLLLLFTSTYRSYATQRWVYDREVRLYGRKVADSESAVPGTSQHQLGVAVDFGCVCDAFASTAAYRWLIGHAAAYGFSQSYPNGMEAVTGYRAEAWHWRYITTAGTTAQRDFFDNVQQYLLRFLHDNRTRLVTGYRGPDIGAGWEAPEIVRPVTPDP